MDDDAAPVPTRDDLDEDGRDVQTAIAKAVLGVVPFVGSALAEIVGFAIPRQRIDRVVAFAKHLDNRLTDTQRNLIATQTANEFLTDIIEEAMVQSTRSISDERRQYLASLVSSSLPTEQEEHAATKQLLRLLGAISDVEVVWLRMHLDPTINGDATFRETHKHVLEPVRAFIGSDRATLDKYAIQTSYKEHLEQLGLLKPRYRMDMKTKQVEVDQSNGLPKIAGYEITLLGRLLLHHIGLGERARNS